MAENKRGDLSVKITADVDEAVAGFKRLQRELREATKAARELEQAYSDVEKAIEECSGFETCKSSDALSQYCSCVDVEIDGRKVAEAIYEPIYASDFGLSTHRDLSEVPTEELLEELSKRSGVEEYVVKHSPGFANLEVGNDVNDWNSITAEEHIEGSARILVIKD